MFQRAREPESQRVREPKSQKARGPESQSQRAKARATAKARTRPRAREQDELASPCRVGFFVRLIFLVTNHRWGVYSLHV